MPLFRSVLEVQLNARLQPMHRATIEDPIAHELVLRFPRIRQIGSGSLLDEDHRLRRADFSFTAPRKDEPLAVASLIDLLRETPRGSLLLVNGTPREVGTYSAVTLVLPAVDGVDYEDEQHVLHTEAVDRVAEEVRAAIPRAFVSWQFTPTATDIHVHGPGDIRSALTSVLEAIPCAAKAEFDVFA